MSDDEPTADEQREAAALAEALAEPAPGAPPAGPAPADALATAALLRYAHTGGRLDPVRQAAIGAAARGAVTARVPRRRWLWWLAPALPAAAGLAVLLAVR